MANDMLTLNGRNLKKTCAYCTNRQTTLAMTYLGYMMLCNFHWATFGSGIRIIL